MQGWCEGYTYDLIKTPYDNLFEEKLVKERREITIGFWGPAGEGPKGSLL